MSIVLTTQATKLMTLLKAEGFRTPCDYIEARGFGGDCPGICRNRGCTHITGVEADQRAGWCEGCEDNTIVSLLVLAEAI